MSEFRPASAHEVAQIGHKVEQILRIMGEDNPQKEGPYFALWITRNGQHMWSGPHSKEQAESVLDFHMECHDRMIIGNGKVEYV